MTQFTKGPWDYKLTGDGKRIRIGLGMFDGPNGYDVAEVYSDDVTEETYVEAQANAHLIAAAPELYEALEALTEMARRMDFSEGVCCCGDSVEGHGFGSGHSPVDAGLYYATEVIETARCALSKARGEA